MKEKQFVIVIISTYKRAGINTGKNKTVPNMIFIKHGCSLNPTERIAISKMQVSDLLYFCDSYIIYRKVWQNWLVKTGRLDLHIERGGLNESLQYG